jgi:hypothetical protein
MHLEVTCMRMASKFAERTAAGFMSLQPLTTSLSKEERGGIRPKATRNSILSKAHHLSTLYGALFSSSFSTSPSGICRWDWAEQFVRFDKNTIIGPVITTFQTRALSSGARECSN